MSFAFLASRIAVVSGAMKHLISILFIGSALTLAACGKDKKPATSDPAPAAAAPADPAKADPAKADPAAPPAGGEAKPEGEKKAGGGW
jgi:hypothetical protein